MVFLDIAQVVQSYLLRSLPAGLGALWGAHVTRH
jgi:hypothetical protein